MQNNIRWISYAQKCRSHIKNWRRHFLIINLCTVISFYFIFVHENTWLNFTLIHATIFYILISSIKRINWIVNLSFKKLQKTLDTLVHVHIFHMIFWCIPFVYTTRKLKYKRTHMIRTIHLHYTHEARKRFTELFLIK